MNVRRRDIKKQVENKMLKGVRSCKHGTTQDWSNSWGKGKICLLCGAQLTEEGEFVKLSEAMVEQAVKRVFDWGALGDMNKEVEKHEKTRESGITKVDKHKKTREETDEECEWHDVRPKNAWIENLQELHVGLGNAEMKIREVKERVSELHLGAMENKAGWEVQESVLRAMKELENAQAMMLQVWDEVSRKKK